MGRLRTTQKAALSTAASVALLSAIPLAAIWYYAGNLPVWPGLAAVLFLFGATYLLSKHFLSEALYKKLNPVYRFLFNTDYKKSASRSEKNILVEGAEENVREWALIRSKEISELKQTEKYRKEFLGNVSHELKTPIFNMQGYVLTLLDGGLEDPSINRLYLERCEKSINRMISIVEDLESISRLESGELQLEFETFNLLNLVRESFEMQEMQARSRDISLILEVERDFVPMVRADRKRIMEVLNNLIVNSIKYGKRKGKTVVSFVNTEDKIIVQIADNGMGIAEKDQTRIFERFYRTDKSRSRDQGGTGLGLSIVKHIIMAHNQDIQLQSKPDQGSVFSFSLDKGA
ncbi:MAG: sensor histidine kinase [Bacteroidales bacterium]